MEIIGLKYDVCSDVNRCYNVFDKIIKKQMIKSTTHMLFKSKK